jgi:hypothetical protein
MKKIQAPFYICLAFSLVINYSFAQSTGKYQLPDGYHFEREIIQVLGNHKNSGDSARVYSYYTNSGDYALMRMEGSTEKSKGEIVITRTGNLLFFNEKEKSVTVISIQNILKDISKLARWVKIDSLMAAVQRHDEKKEIKSAKTGKTKTINGYTASEYSVMDNHGHTSQVWCAKVDFPVLIDYILDAGGNKWLPMINNRLQDRPLLQALISPGTILTDIQKTDSLGVIHNPLRTESIQSLSWDFKTAGYELVDYSNYSFMEIIQAEMRRKMK